MGRGAGLQGNINKRYYMEGKERTDTWKRNYESTVPSL